MHSYARVVKDEFLMRIRSASALVVALALGAASCKGPTGLSDNVTEPFTGTVESGKSDVKTFNVSNTGEIKITLRALTPGGSATLGVLYGQLAGTNCTPAVSPVIATSATVGKSLLDYPIYLKGQYCLLVADYALFANIAPLTETQTYTIDVSHP